MELLNQSEESLLQVCFLFDIFVERPLAHSRGCLTCSNSLTAVSFIAATSFVVYGRRLVFTNFDV